MKPLDVAASRTAEGIEEDILDLLCIESVPAELVTAINNRLHQYRRDIKDAAQIRAGANLAALLALAYE